MAQGQYDSLTVCLLPMHLCSVVLGYSRSHLIAHLLHVHLKPSRVVAGTQMPVPQTKCLCVPCCTLCLLLLRPVHGHSATTSSLSPTPCLIAQLLKSGCR